MKDSTTNNSELVRQAKALGKDNRREILMSYKETDLHFHLKELFVAMEPSYTVEVTHGSREFGKDLVIVRQDSMTTDVIAVVVKCGNIKAKTLGEVDEVVEKINATLKDGSDRKVREIESQIRQAYLHKAELKDFFRTLPVNKVFVVIAGAISGQGRTRLEREISGPVEVFDVEWLISNFTEFYPQVYFEGKITGFLQTKVQELETKHRVIKSNKILSECFVDPVVRTAEVSISLGEELKAVINQKKLPFSRLKSILSTSKRIVLVGDPGTGKSSALAKLAIDLMKEVYGHAVRVGEKRQRSDVPVLVTARDVLAAKDADTLISDYLAEPEIINRLGIKVLMIDGLDEINSDTRPEVVKKAEDFAQHLNCSLIIASRKIDLLNVTPKGFEKFEILPFGAGQALKLIERIHSNNDMLSMLRGGLDKIRHQIPMVPLALILLIEIVEEHKEIPASVTELYERYTDSVLGRYDKEKGIEVLFEYLVKKRFLSTLAFSEFASKNLIEITKADFDAFTQKYAEEFGFSEEKTGKFIHEIERAGVLEVGEETVLFRHRSFLDYFAAFYIFDKRDEFDELNEFIRDIYFNDSWGETAFFYVGLKREINEKLMDKIFEYDRDNLWTKLQKITSGRLLQAGWHSASKIKHKGIVTALSFVPPAREKLYRLAERSKWNEPNIMVDLILMGMSDHSFRSSFLAKELRQVFDAEIERKEDVNLSAILPILWAIRPFISSGELKDGIGKVLEAISTNPEITPEEKVRATILLSVIQSSDKATTKAINKKLRGLYRLYPLEFKNLLPPPPKKQKFIPPAR